MGTLRITELALVTHGSTLPKQLALPRRRFLETKQKGMLR